MFDPTRIGREAPGVHNMIWNTIQKCSMDVRKALVSHIIISGGCTIFNSSSLFKKSFKTNRVSTRLNPNILDVFD